MNFSLFISKRYLFAKKSQNVINVITAVSIIGVAFGTAGLIVVLSVFNGFGNLVLSLYDDFDPDIKITPSTGKFFNPSDAQYNRIKNAEYVDVLSFTIEENALLRYNERQVLGRVKGIDSNYINTAPLKNKIIDGRFLSNQDQEYMAIPGGGVAYYLGLNLKNNFSAINIYIPKPGEINILNPQDAFNTSSVIPIGVFSLQPDFDNKYIIVPLKFAQETINETGKISAIEIQLKKNANAEEAKFAIQKICGKNFNVLTRSEQHDFLNKILSTEKLVSYFVLILILLIATFTITGSLTMLIIEKKRDINILKSLGADTILIKRIFMNEGLLITLLGTVIGLLFGYLVCLIQQTYGIVKLQDAENFIINAYPVGMMISDFLITFAIVAGIGALSSWYAVRNLIR